MENTIKTASEREVDPIGTDLVLSVFSTAITTFILIYPIFSKKFNPGRRYFIERLPFVRKEIINLQNELDNLILTLRWIDIQDAIKEIDQRVFKLLSEIRLLTFNNMDVYHYEALDDNLLLSFDKLLLEMSNLKSFDFIFKMRHLLKDLSTRLTELQKSNG